MATLADLDTEIAQDLGNAAAAIETALTNVETALANAIANNQPPDVQPQIDHIKAIATALRTAAQGASPTITTPPAP